MALLDQDEEQKKPSTGLPSIESVPAFETAGRQSKGVATRLLTDVVEDQDELTQRKIEDAQADTAFLDKLSDAESLQQQIEGQERVEITTGIQENLELLETAQKMNPFIRSFRAIAGQNVKPSRIKQDIAVGQQKLKLFQAGVQNRQQRTAQKLNIFGKRNIAERQEFTAEQTGLNTRIKLAGQFGSLAVQESTLAIKKVETRIKIGSAVRKKRENLITRQTPAILAELKERASNSPTGKVEFEGSTFTVQDITNETLARIKRNREAKGGAGQTLASIQLGERNARKDLVGRLTPDQLVGLKEEATKSPTGTVEFGGSTLTVQDFTNEGIERVKRDQGIAVTQLALNAGNKKVAEQSMRDLLDNFSVDQLTQLERDGGVITSADGETLKVPLGLVAETSLARQKEQNESITVGSDLTTRSATSLFDLGEFQERAVTLTSRIDSLTGNNSIFSKDTRRIITKSSISLNALSGITGESSRNLQEFERKAGAGELTNRQLVQVSNISTAGQESLAKQVKKAAASQFEDKSSRQSAENYLNGVSTSPETAVETFIRSSIGGLPKGVSRSSAEGLTFLAAAGETLKWLQQNMKDAPDFASMTPAERGAAQLAALQDVNGRLKPEHLGLIGKVASAGFNAFVSASANSALINAVSIPDTPAFGVIQPATIEAALRRAEDQALREIPERTSEELAESDATPQSLRNDRAALEAKLFIGTLRGIRIGDTNAANLYLQQLKSPEFLKGLENQAIPPGGPSFSQYLINEGFVQGNFASAMSDQARVYEGINAQFVETAGGIKQELAELFEDPNDSDLFALRIGGFIAGGADPEKVNDFINVLVDKFGGDAAVIWDQIKGTKFADPEQENIRKAIVDGKLTGGTLMSGFLRTMRDSLRTSIGVTIGGPVPFTGLGVAGPDPEAKLSQEEFTVFQSDPNRKRN